MGSTGKQGESGGWEDLQAVGTAATPPYKSKGGRPGAVPAVPRERNDWQTTGQKPSRGARGSSKVGVGKGRKGGVQQAGQRRATHRAR